MGFLLDKKNILSRLDKSKKGDVDVYIQPILNVLNAHKDYYTTSSCSGRILVMDIPTQAKKHEVTWLLSSHDIVTLRDIEQALAQGKHDVWLKQESAILHVVCKNLDAAETLLLTVRKCGMKRSGIISTSKKIVVELINTENMTTLLKKQGKTVVSKAYLTLTLTESNAKLAQNLQKLKKLEKALQKL